MVRKLSASQSAQNQGARGLLPADQVGAFQRDGFLTLESLADESELQALRTMYDEVVTARFGDPPDKIGVTLPGTENSLFTVLSPQSIVPEIVRSEFGARAKTIVAQLCGVEVEALNAGWRLFFKPPRCVATAWHQDAAYRPLPHNGVGLWMTLDPATPTSGCMHYIRGSHRDGLRDHQMHNRHLVADDIDLSREIVCPADPGHAIVHHCLTLHCASPNESARSRRAIAIIFQVAASATNGGSQ
jgi:hypothetical protein